MNDLIEANAVSGAGSRISRTVRLEGVVEHGDARGRELGYPTANICVQDTEIQDGVWAGTVQVSSDGIGEIYAAAISVGRRPTYYRKGTRLLEAHLLGFNGDLYGRTILVTPHFYLRPQRRFHRTDQLISQIVEDVASVRSLESGAEWERLA